MLGMTLSQAGLVALIILGNVFQSHSSATQRISETLQRLLRDFDLSSHNNGTISAGSKTASSSENVNENGWWSGPHVCLSKNASVTETSNTTTDIHNGILTGKLDRSAFSVCREEKNVRICRTVKSLNATATENILTTYTCCTGYFLINNTCVVSDNQVGSVKNTGGSSQETQQVSRIRSSLSDENIFSGYFQQLLKDSSKSQKLFLQALDTDQPQSVVNDIEEDDAETAFQKMAPKDISNRRKLGTTQNVPTTISTAAPSTNNTMSQRSSRAEFEFSISST